MRFLKLGLVVALALPARAGAREPGTEGLESDDRAVVRETIETLGVTGDPAAGPAVAERLARGLDRELTLVALDALGILRHRGAAEAVTALARHRDPSIRLRAIQTLVALEPEGLRATLERGLDDLDPEVRAECARALARFGDVKSLPLLFRALDAGELSAAAPIAAIGDEAAVRQLAGYLGRIPFDALAEPLARALAREELEKRLRLDVVGKLVELASPEVKYFLEDLAGELPGPPGDPVKRAVVDAAFRIVD